MWVKTWSICQSPVYFSHVVISFPLICTFNIIFGVKPSSWSLQELNKLLPDRDENNEEEVQYHYRRLITRDHPIINSVSRPPGLFTWDWKVFALVFPDWLRRPSAASSPQLRFVFCFFPALHLHLFLFITSRVSDSFRADYPSRRQTASAARTCWNSVRVIRRKQAADTEGVVGFSPSHVCEWCASFRRSTFPRMLCKHTPNTSSQQYSSLKNNLAEAKNNRRWPNVSWFAWRLYWTSTEPLLASTEHLYY